MAGAVAAEEEVSRWKQVKFVQTRYSCSINKAKYRNRICWQGCENSIAKNQFLSILEIVIIRFLSADAC